MSAFCARLLSTTRRMSAFMRRYSGPAGSAAGILSAWSSIARNARTTMTWTPIEGTPGEVLARVASPFAALAAGEIPAVVLRQAFPAEQCRAIVRRLYERGGILEREGITYDAVGTSLVNLGANPEVFFAHAGETHVLFPHLFAGLQHPVEFVYR